LSTSIKKRDTHETAMTNLLTASMALTCRAATKVLHLNMAMKPGEKKTATENYYRDWRDEKRYEHDTNKPKPQEKIR